MKKITLENLTLENFKGIKSLHIDYSNITNIYGANEAGKTTTYDAVCFLLFGKNSADKSAFNIQPLTKDGNKLNKIETLVQGTLIVDDLIIKLKKVYKQKWTKPRGQLEEVYTGNTTDFYYNDIPLKESEYEEKMKSIVNEKLFKLLTNPLFFNSIKWEDRRSVLVKLLPEISSETILNKIATNDFVEEIKNLSNAFSQGKCIEEYKKQITGEKKPIKDKLDDLPARIDEAHRSLPNSIPVFSEVEKAIENRRVELSKIDNEIEDRNVALESEFKKIKEQQNEKFEHENKLRNLIAANNDSYVNDINKSKTALNNKLIEFDNIFRKITNSESDVSTNNNKINNINQENARFREEWNTINSSAIKFNENDFSCPTCKRELDADKVENSKKEMTANFNKNKLAKLDEIKSNGDKNNVRITELQKQNEVLSSEIALAKNAKEKIEKEIVELEQNITKLESQAPEETKEIAELKAKINNFIIEPTPTVNVEDLKEKKQSIVAQIDELKTKLALRDVIEKANGRIAELETQQKTLAQQLSNLERQEFINDKYNAEYINTIEESVNKRFSFVKFKMFETLQNGGQVPTCKTTYKGVPFEDLNTAGEIFAGLDIINGLSDYYQISVPVFLDNRESVTEIPPVNSQLINLIVSPSDTVLRVEAVKEN